MYGLTFPLALDDFLCMFDDFDLDFANFLVIFHLYENHDIILCFLRAALNCLFVCSFITYSMYFVCCSVFSFRL